ncbi:hypothetical protein Lal_00016745 [Lupinus albus]|nr:hypothetical protein Lal_00016745 [Lupinus albus]
MKEKKENGMCFRCDEPFTRDRICKNKQLRTIILAEEEEAEKEGEAEEDMKIFNSLQLSLYSMKRLTSTKSWKIGKTLEDKPVMIMIDCGASHNFISKDLVDSLQLRVEETKAYLVKVGNGHKVNCQGKCAQLRFYMQQLEKGSVTVEKLVKIQIPATLKKQLVDDWTFVTQQDKLVTLPRSPTIDEILTKYLEYKTKKDTTVADSIGESLKGIRRYFDRALPMMLLYTKERKQYIETIVDGVSPSTIYGAEHLLRLFVKLPELLAYMTIEEETLNRLQQILLDFLK